MFLAAHTEHHLQEFFRHFTNDATLRLPVVRVRRNALARFVTGRLRIAGITVGRYILLAPSQVEARVESSIGGAMQSEYVVSEELLVHEMMHVLQFERDGFAGFVWRYVGDYLRTLWREKRCDAATRMMAYLAIPAECEARAAASEYAKWRVMVNGNIEGNEVPGNVANHNSPVCLFEN
ncbi:MAG: DUF4157 domain-containing protein [Pyrinomonadaceae bacterium MAG19_C2-C3]|nr:DUF4157 domain-containing protein [Pyrinomonadaceae bacterium MAG19_C2-C3]